MRKIKVIRLDTDDAMEIQRFVELWKKLKPEIEEIFVSKRIEFLGEKKK